jgi:hypothetical protein
MNKLVILAMVAALVVPATVAAVELEITGTFDSAQDGTLYQVGDKFIATVELAVTEDGTWWVSPDASYVQRHSYITTLSGLKMDIYRDGSYFATHDLSEFETRDPFAQSTRQTHPSAYTLGEEFSIFGDLFGGTTYIHTNIYANTNFGSQAGYDAFDWDNYNWGDIFKSSGIISNCFWTIHLAEGGTYSFIIGPIDVVANASRSWSQVKMLFR